MQEVWKEIPGYNGDYFVSNMGRVKSYKRTVPFIMHPTYSDSVHKYQSVQLFKNGSYKIHKVHRLVACAFIQRIKGKDYVNHIDGNPSNNTASNLEWCTLSENSLHSWRVIGRANGGYKRKIICEETGKIYRSLHDCSRELKVGVTSIHKALNLKTKKGERYKCKGLHFKYYD